MKDYYAKTIVFGKMLLSQQLQWRIGQRAVLIRQYAAEQCRGCEFEPHLEQGFRRRETFNLRWSPKPNIKHQMVVISLRKVHGIN